MHIIRRSKNVRVTKPDQCPVLWAANQLQLRFQDDRTSSFRSNQRSRDVEVAFRQQLIKVVTRHTPRNLRKPRLDQSRILLLNPLQLPINLSPTPALLDDAFQLWLASGSYGHYRAVVKQNAQLFHVIEGLPAEQRMRSAGIVS